MEKQSKTKRNVLLTMGIVVAVIGIGRIAMGCVAKHELRKALAGIPDAQIEFKGFHFSLLSGNLELRHVEIERSDSTDAGPGIHGRIEAIRLERVRWSGLFRGEASAKRLLIRGPRARLVLTGKSAEKEDSTSQEASFLKKVSLSELRVEKGDIGLDSQNNSLRASAKDLAFSVRDIGILLADNRVEYNDSCYSFSLDSLDFTDATGLSSVQIGHLSTADAGPVRALALHLYNSVSKEEVAEKMGKVASMWYDAKIDTLTTSPLNIPRMLVSESVSIDSLFLSGPEVVVFQDDRYPPAVPYPTMQEGANSLKMPLLIKQIDARINSFTFIWETTHVNRGTLPMHSVRMAIISVSNAPNNVMEIGLRSGLAGRSRMSMSVFIRNDKRESTHGSMQLFNLDASRLDPFLRPLFGATAKADIQQIDCSFKGDKYQMTNNFCMQYSQLSLMAWNDSSAPFQIVAKNSGFVSFLANAIIPTSNPTKPGAEPKRVEVTFERDPMLPYPSYLIQNLTTGMLRTVLPGGTIRKTKE